MESKGKNGHILTLATIIVGAAILSFGMYSSVKYFKSYDRVVSVKGLAEKEVLANRVIWPIAFKEIGNDLAALYSSINAKNKIIKEYLVSNGLDETEISVSAPQIVDMNAERYQSQPVSYRYNITSVLTVTSEKVDLVI